MSKRESRITYPFPLRPDLVVELRVPEDLKQSEARRLAAFIETLALGLPHE